MAPVVWPGVVMLNPSAHVSSITELIKPLSSLLSLPLHLLLWEQQKSVQGLLDAATACQLKVEFALQQDQPWSIFTSPSAPRNLIPQPHPYLCSRPTIATSFLPHTLILTGSHRCSPPNLSSIHTQSFFFTTQLLKAVEKNKSIFAADIIIYIRPKKIPSGNS